MRHLACYLLPVSGVLFFVVGLLGDCLLGLFLFFRGGWQLYGWHLLFTLIWVLGVHLITRREKRGMAGLFEAANKWETAAFLLGAGTFPGLGASAYSVACLVVKYAFGTLVRQGQEVVVPEERSLYPAIATPSDVTGYARLADDPENDIEPERVLIAAISRAPSPLTTQFLRQLLSDPRPEIRSDASIALSRLDDEMSHTLHICFTAWQAHPADLTLRLALARQYYEYAGSNVLDDKCQHMYLALARDLLLQAELPEEQRDAQWWLLLARIRQRLGECSEALKHVQQALCCQPDVAGATLLALELAFRVQAWDVFFALASQEACILARQTIDPAAQAIVQWWTQPGLAWSGEAYHG